MNTTSPAPEDFTAEALLEQAPVLRKARSAERKAKETSERAAEKAAEQARTERLAAQKRDRTYRHLEPEIERQLKEIGGFVQRYLGPRSKIDTLRNSRKTLKSGRDPVSYEYRYEEAWESGETRGTAWTLLGGAISADGTWWVSSRDKNSSSWLEFQVEEIVAKLSTTGSWTLGTYEVRIQDRGDHRVDLLARQPGTDTTEQKLSDIVVEAAVKRGERN